MSNRTDAALPVGFALVSASHKDTCLPCYQAAEKCVKIISAARVSTTTHQGATSSRIDLDGKRHTVSVMRP